MDIHKPKPVHSLREFLSEIAVVVCGIAIALTGEQALETLHWREKVREAETAMRYELATDDGPQAYARIAAARCLNGQLQAIIDAAERPGGGAEAVRLAAAYLPPIRTWDHQGWDAAVGADIGSHIGAERLNLWSAPYAFVAGLGRSQDREVDNLDLLIGAPPPKGGALTADQVDRIVRAASALQHTNISMAESSLLLLKADEAVDAAPPKAERDKILADARRAFGACVTEPQPDKLPNLGQFLNNVPPPGVSN